MKGHSQLRKGRCSIPNQIYHVSTATHEGQPLFENFQCGRAIIDCMRREHEMGHVESLAFVIMPDHLHWLFSLSGSRSLSECIKNVKSYSARRVGEILGSSGKVWQTGYYDRAIRQEEDLEGVARYIVANPLRAGIARSVREYALWDAKWL